MKARNTSFTRHTYYVTRRGRGWGLFRSGLLQPIRLFDGFDEAVAFGQALAQEHFGDLRVVPCRSAFPPDAACAAGDPDRVSRLSEAMLQ